MLQIDWLIDRNDWWNRNNFFFFYSSQQPYSRSNFGYQVPYDSHTCNVSHTWGNKHRILHFSTSLVITDPLTGIPGNIKIFLVENVKKFLVSLILLKLYYPNNFTFNFNEYWDDRSYVMIVLYKRLTKVTYLMYIIYHVLYKVF